MIQINWLSTLTKAGLSADLSQLTLVAMSCLTLCNPMDCSPPDHSVHEILQTGILEWVAISFSKGWLSEVEF